MHQLARELCSTGRSEAPVLHADTTTALARRAEVRLERVWPPVLATYTPLVSSRCSTRQTSVAYRREVSSLRLCPCGPRPACRGQPQRRRPVPARLRHCKGESKTRCEITMICAKSYGVISGRVCEIINSRYHCEICEITAPPQVEMTGGGWVVQSC